MTITRQSPPDQLGGSLLRLNGYHADALEENGQVSFLTLTFDAVRLLMELGLPGSQKRSPVLTFADLRTFNTRFERGKKLQV